MPPSNRSERSTADEERETPVDANGTGGRQFGRRVVRGGLLLGSAVAVGVAVLRRRRRRRDSEREFTEIELDDDGSDDR